MRGRPTGRLDAADDLLSGEPAGANAGSTALAGIGAMWGVVVRDALSGLLLVVGVVVEEDGSASKVVVVVVAPACPGSRALIILAQNSHGPYGSS